MVYTADVPVSARTQHERGYAIHPPVDPLTDSSNSTDTYWQIYSDDGHGNGDFLCFVYTESDARWLAGQLDKARNQQ